MTIYPLNATQEDMLHESDMETMESGYLVTVYVEFPAKHLSFDEAVTACQKVLDTVHYTHVHLIRQADGQLMVSEATDMPNNVWCYKMSYQEWQSRKPEFSRPYKLLEEPGVRLGVIETEDKTIITPQYQEFQVLDGPWKVTFQEGRGAPEEATFASLIDWTTHSDEGIRYYSGIATYTTTFYVDHPADITLLGLGSVKNMAAVSINGTSCGTAWKAPWQVQIPDGVLREGENVLTVRVANLWVNRIIGDRRQQTRFTSTPNPFYSADDALLPSGLLGPVILFQENKRIFVRK